MNGRTGRDVVQYQNRAAHILGDSSRVIQTGSSQFLSKRARRVIFAVMQGLKIGDEMMVQE